MDHTFTRRDFFRSLGAAAAALLVSVVLGSCATVDPQPEWQKLAALSKERAPAELIWQQSDTDAQVVRDKVQELLADGLSRQDAVQVALLNSPELQADFEELGVARANLVQAGLFTNPSLSVFIGFPINLADSSVGLTALLSDLWTVPAREKIFSSRAEGTVQRVAAAVVDTAADTSDAYDEAVYRLESLHLEHRVLEVRKQASAQTQTRYDKGLANDLDVVRAQSEVFDQELSVGRAELELARARAHLDQALALPETHADYRITDKLEVPPPSEWTVEAAIPFALDHRLDLAFRRIEVERRERELALERREVLGPVGIGPGYEGAFGQEDVWGPLVGLSLPIFDQNQAQIAKAEYRLRQARLQLAATELQARTDVKNALATLEFRRKQVDTIHHRLEPLRARAVEYTERWSSGMHLTFLDLLHARAQEITIHREHLQALWEMRRTQVRLQRALWGASENDDPD